MPLAPTVGPPRPRPIARAPLLLLIAGILAAVIVGALMLGSLGRRNDSLTTRPGATSPATGQATAAPAAEWLLPGAPGRIAFGQLNSGGFDLFAVTLDGAPPQPLIAGGNDTAPAWSPDGRQLAITHADGGERGVYVGPADNPAARRVSPAGVEARYAAWSPDGRQLAFTTLNNGVWTLEVLDLASGELSAAGPQWLGWVAWLRGALLYAARPDADSPQDIFAVDVGGAPVNLTNTPDAEEDFPDRSPDGRRIVFVASLPGQPNLPQRQIYVMRADGGGREQLTQAPGPHTNPVWSPDGRWIAYLSQAGGGDWQVWAMRADGSQARQLTFGPGRKFYLAWGR